MGSPCLCLSCSAVILENHQKILSFCKNYINATVLSILFASRGLYNLWAPNAESHVIYCIYTNNTTSTIFYLSLKYILWVLITFPYIIVLPTSLIIIRNRPSKGGYVCPESEFQNLLFRVLRRRPCRYRYFTIVFALFSVAVTVSIHLCVVCRHFCCPMSLFQGHVLLVEILPNRTSRKRPT